jgi:hypothetical protein
VHGSEQCFRKFLNAGAAYGPDVMVLGGDVAGKAVQAVVRVDDDRYRFSFRGREHDLPDGDELRRVERLIADNGYYPWRSAPGELDARMAAGTVDALLLDLMRERLSAWLALADERLRPQDLPASSGHCSTPRRGARTPTTGSCRWATRTRSSRSATRTRRPGTATASSPRRSWERASTPSSPRSRSRAGQSSTRTSRRT